MRVDALTASDMQRLMQRLATNFGGKKDLDAKTELYFDKLERFPRAAVEAAVELALEGEGYFPKVGQLKKHALAYVAKHGGPPEKSLRQVMREWEGDPWGEGSTRDYSAPCPVCAETLEWSPRGLVIVHDDAKHTAARMSFSNVGDPTWWDRGPVPPAPRETVAPPRTPNPYPIPAPAATAIAAVVPQALKQLASGPPPERGDAYEEEP